MERRYVNALMLNACRLIYCRAITATRVKGVLRRLASPCLCEKCEDRCDDRKNCAPIEITGRRSVEIGDEDRLKSAKKTGWDRRRRSVGIGDEDRLESATIRVRRESENMRYLDEILLEGENDIGDRYKFRLSSMNI